MTGLNRRLLLATGGAAGGLAVARSMLAAPAVAKDLKGSGSVAVYDGGGAWGEAKRLAYFDPFERETGIKVIAVPRTDKGAIQASVRTGTPRYDVANLNGATTESFARGGLLLPIDYGWFEKANIDAFDPVPTGKFTVPHIIYSLVIAYEAGRFTDPGPATWADVWDTRRFPGGRALPAGTWGAAAGIYECALMADGVEPSKLYPIDWDRAFKSLERIRPSVLKWWASGAEAVQLIVDRQATIGSAWNGRVSAANDQAVKVGLTWNQGILQYDCWSVLKGARNVENAMKFIAFTARPQNQAKFVERILYAPPNAKAYDFISPERAKLLPTAPDARKLQFVQNYDFWNSAGAGGVVNDALAVADWEKWITGTR